MKSVKDALYILENLEVKKILQKKGVIVEEIRKAWKKYPVVRKFLKEKPELGYFIWIKKSVDFPITTCVYATEKNLSQVVTNLVLVNPRVKGKGVSYCWTNKDLKVKHIAEEIVVLGKNSEFELEKLHNWHTSDNLMLTSNYFLNTGSKLSVKYKNFSSAGNMTIQSNYSLGKSSSVDSLFSILATKASVDLKESAKLEGKSSSAKLYLRIVASKTSEVKGITQAVAYEESKAHLDCQGLLVDKTSKIHLVPELEIHNPKALLTHEASIGRIEKDALEYLQTRGFSKKQAMDLIIRGFLSFNSFLLK